MSDDLAALFPEGDYRFHLSLRRSEPRAFFAPQDDSGAVLTERRRWLREHPGRHAALLPGSGPMLREFGALAPEWGVGTAADATPRFSDAGDLDAELLRFGGVCEPDVLFLAAESPGQFTLRGGVLCFPTGWALEEKLGRTLDAIHDVVPGLNPALGSPIRQFLSRLRPGAAYLRDNWGIAATDERNLHPARGLAPPQPPVALDRLWLRVEHQALVSLPDTGAVVFGIRIALHRLDTLAGGPAGDRLRRALLSMPPEILEYKRLKAVKDELAGQL